MKRNRTNRAKILTRIRLIAALAAIVLMSASCVLIVDGGSGTDTWTSLTIGTTLSNQVIDGKGNEYYSFTTGPLTKYTVKVSGFTGNLDWVVYTNQTNAEQQVDPFQSSTGTTAGLESADVTGLSTYTTYYIVVSNALSTADTFSIIVSQ